MNLFLMYLIPLVLSLIFIKIINILYKESELPTTFFLIGAFVPGVNIAIALTVTIGFLILSIIFHGEKLELNNKFIRFFKHE